MQLSNKAVFLDRDGTIIEHVNYLSKCDEVKLLPKVEVAIKLLNESKFKVIVVTNQSGVARGYFTEKTVRNVNKYVLELLNSLGAYIDGVYYCPHHIEGTMGDYGRDCYCRKPNPGMLKKAACDFSIDLTSSFVVGDTYTDVEAGRRVGCKTVLLADRRDSSMADHVTTDLHGAVKWIMKESRS